MSTDTDIEQHPAADNHTVPDDWYLLSKEEGGDEKFFCQHPETMGTTNTHDDPADAVEEAREMQERIDAATHSPATENGTADTTDADNEKMTNGEMPNDQMPNDQMIVESTPDTTQPVEVLDEDEGEYVKVTPEMRAQAQHALHQVQGTILVTAYWIARIYDEQLYVGVGCNSKTDFVENHLPFGERQAQKYAKIGRRLGQFLPGHEEVDPEKLPSAEVSSEDVPESFQGLPMGKLNELTKLDQDDLNDYVETGKWQGPNGEEYTREDVLEMARADLGDVVSERTERLRETLEEEKAKRQDYEELAEKRKEEKEALEDELEERAEQIEAAEDIERRLGPTVSKLEEKRRLMRETREHVDEAIRLAGQIGITDEDPEADQQNLQDLLGAAQRLVDVLHEDYADVLIGL